MGWLQRRKDRKKIIEDHTKTMERLYEVQAIHRKLTRKQKRSKIGLTLDSLMALLRYKSYLLEGRTCHPKKSRT